MTPGRRPAPARRARARRCRSPSTASPMPSNATVVGPDAEVGECSGSARACSPADSAFRLMPICRSPAPITTPSSSRPRGVGAAVVTPSPGGTSLAFSVALAVSAPARPYRALVGSTTTSGFVARCLCAVASTTPGAGRTTLAPSPVATVASAAGASRPAAAQADRHFFTVPCVETYSPGYRQDARRLQ